MRRPNGLVSIIYMGTLIALLYVVIQFTDFSLWKEFFVLLAAAVAHFIVFFIAVMYLNKKRNRPFYMELKQITDRYMEDEDSEAFYNALVSMEHKPASQDALNTLCFNKSTALYGLGLKSEALAELNRVVPTSKQMEATLKQQRTFISNN